jgi:peptidyl-dipeptidase Dcp
MRLLQFSFIARYVLVIARPYCSVMDSVTQTNPLLLPWTGPFGGVPHFDKVKVEHFKAAFDVAMAEKTAEVAAITAANDPPSFANTIEALEQSGSLLERVSAVYGVWSNGLSSPDFQTIEQELAPRLAEFADSIWQNSELFARIEKVYTSTHADVSHDGLPSPNDDDGLSPQQRRLLWLVYTNFIK